MASSSIEAGRRWLAILKRRELSQSQGKTYRTFESITNGFGDWFLRSVGPDIAVTRPNTMLG